MKKAVSLILIQFLLLDGAVFAAPKSIQMPRMPEQAVEKPQMAKDMEGLDPREAKVSQGLRGSFMIRHYVSGPYKGGTAVIEVASDSSYAEVRIFDKDGNLQRIYSIQPRAQNTRLSPSKTQNPVDVVRPESATRSVQESGDEVSVTRSRAREEAVEEQTSQAVRESQEEAASDRPQPRRGTVSSRVGDIREVEPEEPVAVRRTRQVSPAARGAESSADEATPAEPGVSAGAGTESVAAAPKKRTIRVRRKRKAKKSNSLDTPLSGSPAKQDEYYYEEVVVEEKQPAARVEVAQKPAPAVVPAPVTFNPFITNEVPASKAVASSKSGSSQSRSAKASASSAQEAAEASAKDLEHSIPRSAGTIAVASSGGGSSSGGGKAGETSGSAYDDSNLPDVTDAVQDNEKESKGKGKSRGKGKSAAAWEVGSAPAPVESTAGAGAPPSSSAAKTPPPPVQESEPAPPPEKVGKKKLDSDEWKPKPTVVAALPGSAVEMPPPAAVTPKAQRVEQPEVDISAAQKAASKLDSDGWAPKATKAAPTDAELGLTDLGAAPSSEKGKRGKKKKGESDDLVPLSDQARGGAGGSGDSWTPNASPAKLAARDEQQLAMVNMLKTPASQPVSRPLRDVNNPEEGMKPFYSLEKYSGAQFGRHREFERRVMYKQNPKTSVKGYDFYIDEVDRKQEKHYLYYYKLDPKTKKAKLIATEKHEKVTFLGNYDIGSEDKGKIDKE